jgi:predicted amidohydrolase YtcJ
VIAPGAPADFAVVDDPGGAGGRFFPKLLESTGRENVRMTVVAGRPAHGGAN